MPKGEPLELGQRRVHKKLKIILPNLRPEEVRDMALADKSIKRLIKDIYIGGSRLLFEEEEFISKSKWTLNEENAKEEAKKYKDFGGGVVYKLDFEKLRQSPEFETLYGCFTTLQNDEVIAQMVKKKKVDKENLNQNNIKLFIENSEEGVKVSEGKVSGNIYQTDVYFDNSCKIFKDNKYLKKVWDTAKKE